MSAFLTGPELVRSFAREYVFRRDVYAIASLHFFDALADCFNDSGAI
jgi:hypothetical protein